MFWSPSFSMDHLMNLRRQELESVIGFFGSKSNLVLEIGAGSGFQSNLISKKGYSIEAIDVESSNYYLDRIWNVKDYNGSQIPFPDDYFNVVYTSNVMEHVVELEKLNSEIYRVLKKDGIVVHVIPSSAWRFFTSVTHMVKYWTIPKVHGEHSNDIFDEFFKFGMNFWRSVFNKEYFKIQTIESNKLFYTGTSLFGRYLSIRMRVILSRVFSSSCNIYVLEPKI